jgi:hypothetical protein
MVRWTEKEDGYDVRAHPVSEATNIYGRDSSFFPLFQTGSGFILDRDQIVQSINNMDLKFRVYFGEPLQV